MKEGCQSIKQALHYRNFGKAEDNGKIISLSFQSSKSVYEKGYKNGEGEIIKSLRNDDKDKKV